MKNDITKLILVVILIFFVSKYFKLEESEPKLTEYKKEALITETDVSDIVNAKVAFTGQDIFLTGTTMPAERVRILRLNSDNKDLGSALLDGSTYSVTPGEKYKFYFFMNSTAPSPNYYVDVEEYAPESKESVVNLAGKGCALAYKNSSVEYISFSSKNSAGVTQSAAANAQAMTTSTDYSMSVRIGVGSDVCYGMPDASDGNVICFAFNSNAFSRVYTDTKPVSPPTNIQTAAAGNRVSCYEFQKLKDLDDAEISITLTTGTTEPTIAHNITVYSDDIAFDLNRRTLDEIYGYEDEDGNQLSSPYITLGKLYIS